MQGAGQGCDGDIAEAWGHGDASCRHSVPGAIRSCQWSFKFAQGASNGCPRSFKEFEPTSKRSTLTTVPLFSS